MIVLDASAVLEILRRGSRPNELARDLALTNDSLIAPHLLDVEVAGAFRRLAAAHRIDAHLSTRVLSELATLPIERYAHAPLLQRMWELRSNFTCYDACYIALAEATHSTLYTCDPEFSKGHRAQVRIFAC